MITPAELMGEADGSPRYGQGFVQIMRTQPARFQPVRVVADGNADKALAKALMERYGKSGEESVSASALGLSREALAVLDADGDGKLSLAELARFADKPADVTFTVCLGKREGKPLLTLHPGKALPAGLQVNTTTMGATLQLARPASTCTPWR